MTPASKPVTTHRVAALPYRRDEATGLSVLLVTSRTRRRWILPKGKVPPGMLPSSAAEREAFEEAGVLGRIERAPIPSHRKDHADGLRGERFSVQTFALEVTDELSSWQEMRQRERRWFAMADAINAVQDREIRRMLRSFAHAWQA
jgi:8-oxo-dGTP pyrophosphatase MutT (NUDIX family)